jgi:hypothetical protein
LLWWSDASGRRVESAPRAVRLDERNVLTRTLDGIALGVPEKFYASVPFSVPDGDNVNEYPVEIRIAAEGAEREIVGWTSLRIGRDPRQ